ncbi:nucleotidyltransferase domain-containing protein [Steroidobacter cummioxidans]|uniref:nucleotidyltransferase domain-containing protein n=1 Tax=Steroidobacter cummioxidans TaxID=1803913 RepID=UPI001379FDE0|nr:nucleotidyltransferase domain-containing protein [Steroidobacter cummioxidans]
MRQELARIEREFRVKVLLAVESGSRAWGFASPDSDYDVRFVYVHERDWYLSIYEQRDVIEAMLPGDLDVSGWELRKALRLFAKCNLALNEWLLSPETYSEVPAFREELGRSIPHFFNAISGIHHYRSTAEAAFNDNFADGRIKIKKLFYVLRPLLACRWIEESGSQPPTEFGKLVAADWITEDERRWIAELLRQKSESREAEPIALDARRASSIRMELDRFSRPTDLVPPPTKQPSDALDRILRKWIVPFGKE